MTPLEFEKKDSRWEYEFQSGGAQSFRCFVLNVGRLQSTLALQM